MAAKTPSAVIPTISMPSREAAPVELGEEPVFVPLLELGLVLEAAVVVVKPELLVVEVWLLEAVGGMLVSLQVCLVSGRMVFHLLLVPELVEELVVGAAEVGHVSAYPRPCLCIL
jgi:hypothetical protein